MTRARTLTSGAVALLLIASASTARAQRDRHEENPPRPVPQAEQQARIHEEQQRSADYREHMDERVRTVHQEAAALENQRRAEAYRAQQQYAEELARQQERNRVERDYSRDPYIAAPHTYRYIINGAPRETNQFGLEVLRRAINSGYEQGFRAGMADRNDHWRFDYQNSVAYRDANFGYDGSYVDRADYNYDFRQGFQRGYEDGYNNRYQYGAYSNGNYSMLGNVVTSILGLTTIH